MAQYYFGAHQPSLAPSAFSANMSAHNNHHGNNRSRRSGRFTAPQAPQKQLKTARSPKETTDATNLSTFRKDFEAARSFDLEDDEIFCPWHLLTDDDLQSIHSASSDRASSSGSGSPENSPLQPQLQPTPAFVPPAMTHLGHSPYQQSGVGQMKLHQPLAQRTRNAIPIVDPNSRNASPPTSISPVRHTPKNGYSARRW